MTTLVVKNLPEHLHEQLRRQAESNHRSLTKEVVSLIEAAVSQPGVRKSSGPQTLSRGRGLTAAELEAAITDDRYAHYASLDALNLYMDDLRADRDEVTAADMPR